MNCSVVFLMYFSSLYLNVILLEHVHTFCNAAIVQAVSHHRFVQNVHTLIFIYIHSACWHLSSFEPVLKHCKCHPRCCWFIFALCHYCQLSWLTDASNCKRFKYTVTFFLTKNIHIKTSINKIKFISWQNEIYWVIFSSLMFSLIHTFQALFSHTPSRNILNFTT